jgi:hypothetical protein
MKDFDSGVCQAKCHAKEIGFSNLKRLCSASWTTKSEGEGTGEQKKNGANKKQNVMGYIILCKLTSWFVCHVVFLVGSVLFDRR